MKKKMIEISGKKKLEKSEKSRKITKKSLEKFQKILAAKKFRNSENFFHSKKFTKKKIHHYFLNISQYFLYKKKIFYFSIKIAD